jgi:methionyl-tRNA formyltransferase
LLRFGGAAQDDVCLLLSYGRLLSAERLALHRHNLVMHESALPQGQVRGR